MGTQLHGAGAYGFDVEALERAINEADRNRVHQIFAEAGARLADASLLMVMTVASELLHEIYDRDRIGESMHAERPFLEALRMVGLCSDSAGAMEMLERFFHSLCGQSGKRTPGDADWQTYVRIAIEYMHRAYGNPGLKIEEVANYAYISTSYLTLLIKRETGKTFSEILTEIRMEQAALLLADTNHRTYEIAAYCGFANATYFSTVFHQTFGMSPTEYRRRRKKLDPIVQSASNLKDS